MEVYTGMEGSVEWSRESLEVWDLHDLMSEEEGEDCIRDSGEFMYYTRT